MYCNPGEHRNSQIGETPRNSQIGVTEHFSQDLLDLTNLIQDCRKHLFSSGLLLKIETTPLLSSQFEKKNPPEAQGVLTKFTQKSENNHCRELRGLARFQWLTPNRQANALERP